ncbi:hypothetical protein DFH09DRAFT_1324704 [Mycena vulgaris]|nr:hypothetical protein DFH09DRAFT_1324704 [Mycena vulgaris]
MRGACRVKDWVKLLLYCTLVITARTIDELPLCDVKTFTRIAQTKSASFMRESVRNAISR